jgi:hypothetical protein
MAQKYTTRYALANSTPPCGQLVSISARLLRLRLSARRLPPVVGFQHASGLFNALACQHFSL